MNTSMQRVLGRMWASYTNALRLYAEHRQGREESIQDIAKDPRRPTETERVDGAVRWVGNAIAKGIVDDWRVEEQRVQLSANVATVDLLSAILTQLEEMNQKLNQLWLRGEAERNFPSGKTDPDSLLD